MKRPPRAGKPRHARARLNDEGSPAACGGVVHQHEQATYHGGAPSLVSATLDETYLRWNHDGATQEYSGGYWQTALIVGGDDRPLGYVLTRKLRWAEALNEEALTLLNALVPAIPSRVVPQD